MGRVTLICLWLPLALPAQQDTDLQFREAGVCARCHVISVVEWGLSGHRNAATNCVACHGESRGHVVDERNNVKPERLPREAAIAGLCAGCHTAGCPHSKRKDECQTCHHPHALKDPGSAPAVTDEALQTRAARWQAAERHRSEGERLLKLAQWEKARIEFAGVLRDKPGDEAAAARMRLCERRLHPALPGFESVNGEVDGETGLPREVHVAGLGIRMRLVPGGDVELGSEKFPASQPVHSVRIESFYLGQFEITQAEWKALMGSNPSAMRDDLLPVEQVSWQDAREMIRTLNGRVPGGGFRLPTEAEWEHAVRGGGGEAVEKLAWFGAARDAGPHPPGLKAPNRLGLYDLQGNVWEWCSTLFAPYPYDARDGRENPSLPGLRVLRGGGYADTADLLDPGLRHSERPERRLRWNGVRLARTVPAPRP